MYGLMGAFSLVTALVQVWQALNGDPQGMVTAALITAVAAAIVLAAVLSSRGYEREAAILVAWAVVSLSVAISLVHQDPALAVTLPIIGFVLVLPHLRGRPLLVFAAVVVIAITIVGRASAVARAGPTGEVSLDIVFGGLMGATVLMLFTWRLVRSREELADRMTRFVEGVPLGIFKADGMGRLTEVNGALARLLGYQDRSDLIGMDAAGLMPLAQTVIVRTRVVSRCPP